MALLYFALFYAYIGVLTSLWATRHGYSVHTPQRIRILCDAFAFFGYTFLWLPLFVYWVWQGVK